MNKQKPEKKMSTSPYSLDLRKRTVEHVLKGNTIVSASKLFSINVQTIRSWLNKYINNEGLEPKKRPGAKGRVNKEEFECFINKNPNKTSREIGKEFGISESGAKYYLKKFNFKYKKKPSNTWRHRKKREVSSSML